jgi:uncharacterized protein YjbI with pentapeptide repeats
MDNFKSVAIDATQAAFIYRALCHYEANVIAIKLNAESSSDSVTDQYKETLLQVANFQETNIQDCKHIFQANFTASDLYTSNLLPKIIKPLLP